MKKLEFVLKNFKSRCLDNRDTCRLGEYVPKDKLSTIGLQLKEGIVHNPKAWNRENILDDLKRDINFGYEKAIDGRGISTALMSCVVAMWDWILTDDKKTLENQEDIFDLYSNTSEFIKLAKKYDIKLEASK